MITVKKDAIKYKNADGQMQSAGVLCKVGTFGVDLWQYVKTLQGVFHNAVFEPDLEIIVNVPNFTGTLFNAFNMATNMKKITLIGGELVESINYQNAFYNNTTLECVDLTKFNRKIANGTQAFASTKALKTILGALDFSKATSVSYIFHLSTALEEVRFEPNTLSLSLMIDRTAVLSDESIQSIIDGLADLTGQTTQTLTFHADVKAKLTETQIAQITSKNWTLA